MPGQFASETKETLEMTEQACPAVARSSRTSIPHDATSAQNAPRDPKFRETHCQNPLF